MENLAGDIRQIRSASIAYPWPATPARVIRILTVDEHPVVREGLAAVINREPGMTVVAEAGSGAEAIMRCQDCKPDVVTLDLFLPDIAGEELARRIQTRFAAVRVVVVTGIRGDAHLLRALQAGARGVVLKGMPHAEMVDTIRQVHAGRKVVPRQVATALAEHFGEETLTPREIQVLRLVAAGNRNKQVAAQLSIADETVRMHMKNILGKLVANDRTHAVTIALSRGIFQL